MAWRSGKLGDPAIHPAYHEVINKGDSGHPVFWVTRAGLVLASTLSTPSTGPDFGNPELQRSLQRAINITSGDESYAFRTVPVP